MAATRIYSTAMFVVAAVIAIVLGFSPKFGALIQTIPLAVMGGVSIVVFGLIAVAGARIWVENRVDFANPVNLVPVAAGIIAGVGGLAVKFTKDFSITGIAAGTIIVLVGYHAVRWLAPAHLREEPQAGGRSYEGGTMISTGNVDTPEGEVSPFRGEFGDDSTT
jgi:xanthine/uracil permease